VGAWPVPLASCSRRKASPVHEVRVSAVEVRPVFLVACGRRAFAAGPLGFVYQPWGRGRSPRPRVAAVGALSVPLAPCGRRGGVVGPPGPVWPTCGRGRSHWHLVFAVGCGWSPGPRVAAVGAWPVF